MLEWLKPVLDPYERKARLNPGLFCGVPLAASIVLLIPEFGAWGSIGAVVVYCGGSQPVTGPGRRPCRCGDGKRAAMGQPTHRFGIALQFSMLLLRGLQICRPGPTPI